MTEEDEVECRAWLKVKGRKPVSMEWETKSGEKCLVWYFTGNGDMGTFDKDSPENVPTCFQRINCDGRCFTPLMLCSTEDQAIKHLCIIWSKFTKKQRQMLWDYKFEYPEKDTIMWYSKWYAASEHDHIFDYDVEKEREELKTSIT